MYLISKPETEFSGQVSVLAKIVDIVKLFSYVVSYNITYLLIYTLQESYVWDHYIRRNWSFFPVGDCVQEQERRERERLKQNQVAVL